METFLVADKMSQLVGRLQFWEEEGSAVQVTRLWPLWLFGLAINGVILWVRSTFLNEELYRSTHYVFMGVIFIYFCDALAARLLCCSAAECLHMWWTCLPQLPQLVWAGECWLCKARSWGKAVWDWELSLCVSKEIFRLQLTTWCNPYSASIMSEAHLFWLQILSNCSTSSKWPTKVCFSYPLPIFALKKIGGKKY